ncbi:MAG: hypothetical protein GX122_04840 [Candidatus Cloacimonetes bacterium]|nr:hypothetical protein [Candidatus Cloacimonadota bacterium]
MKKVYALIIMAGMALSLLANGFTWYSQADSRWKQNSLGQGTTSIGKSGCVLSCLSMLLNSEASNPRVTPDQLNSWLRRNGGYSGNLMRWEMPAKMFGEGMGFELESRINKTNDWDYLATELDKGNKVIVQVSGKRSHWVLVVKRDGPAHLASSYIVNDPGTSQYQNRTLAHWGGFKAARSYSGNWLDEDAFELTSNIFVDPVPEDEEFLYRLVNRNSPANVYVTLQNALEVPIHGYFLLGLFDKEDNFLEVVDYQYGYCDALSELDLIYEIEDITPVNEEGGDLRIIYSKYFSGMPSLHEALALPSPGLINYSEAITQ